MLLGPDAKPIARAGQAETGFTAASEHHRAMALWCPPLWRVDDLVKEKRSIESRVLDVSRNNPGISGAIRTQIDGIVGAKFRLALRPDNRLLGIGRETLKDWVKAVEAEWTSYAESPECWIDARRERTFTDLIRLAVGQDIYHGEFAASKEWQTSPLGYKTCFQVIDPTRICPPDSAKFDEASKYEFGIRRNGIGAATGYSILTRKRRDGYYENQFRTIPKYNSFGWLQFIHIFDPMRPDQARGISRMAAALSTVKQLDRFHETELEQSIIAASYAMFIKSSMPDLDKVFGSSTLTPEFKSLLEARNQHYEKTPIQNRGASIGHLMPGEEIETVNIGHPNKSFDSFIAANGRMIARSLGMSYEKFTGDLSRTSYASARAAFMLDEQFNASRREVIAKRAATLMFKIWLDEAVDRGRVTPPVDYWASRSALSRCEWIPSRAGHLDDLKTARAREVNLRTGVQTHQEIAAEDGYDWEERFHQRVLEAECKVTALENMGVSVSDALKAQMIVGDLNGSPFDGEISAEDLE